MTDYCAHRDAELPRAIFLALEAARDVAVVFSQVEANSDLAQDKLDPIGDVLRGELGSASFSNGMVLRLRRLVEGIEPAIAAETRTSVHFDECCTSGAWEETHMTERGHALNRFHRASSVLADRIATVVDIKRTESLTKALTR